MTVNRNENALAGRIDRTRDKAAASARTNAVRELARAETNCAVKSQPEEVREAYIRAAGDQLRTLAGDHMGEAAAVGMFGGLAHSNGLAINRAIASARAEQLFAPKAANDGDEG